jgi:dihydroorotate dehydrogenase
MFLMNAAGPNTKTYGAITKLVDIRPLTHVVTGSWTLYPKPAGGKFWVDADGTSYNNMGLPNGGIKSLVGELPDILDNCRLTKKQLVVNLAMVNNPAEYVIMAKELIPWAKDLIIELNFSCPNNGGPPIFFDLDAMRKVLSNPLWATVPFKEIWAKVAPILDDWNYLERAALLLNAYVTRIVSCNTLQVVAGPRVMGMGGNGLKMISRRNINQYTQVVPRDRLIACGGITTGPDAAYYTGMAGIQVGTYYMWTDVPAVFTLVGSAIGITS